MKKKIIVKGPVLTRSGYGEQARFALRALRSREDLYDIYIKPLNWGKTSWMSDDDEERRWIDGIIEKTINHLNSGGTFDMSLQVTIPNEFERMASINIGYTAGIETTKVSPQWLMKSNEMDKIIVVSNHSKDVFLNSLYDAENQFGNKVLLKMQAPIEVVGYPVKTFGEQHDLNLGLETAFNFLCVAQMGPRKNLENTIKWFVEEFRNEDVGLVVKTNMAKNSVMDRLATSNEMKSLLNSPSLKERTCKVYLIHGDMSDSEIHSLYVNKQINAFVSLTHGEGFGLPLFEAAYSGLPVVATGWSGQLDFLIDNDGKERFYNVEYDLQPVPREVVWNEIIVENSMWAYPRENSARAKMRECYENRNAKEISVAYDSLSYSKEVSVRFSKQEMYNKFVMEILGKSSLKPSEINGISFCIPTNASRIDKTLLTIKSIKKEMQGFPHEIIIAGKTRDFMNDSVFDNMIDHYIESEENANNGNVGALRNIAAESSEFDVIAWCDDDILLGEGWLENTISYTENNGWEILGNVILNPDGTRHWDRAIIQPHIMVDYDVPNYMKGIYQTSGFFMVRKEIFRDFKFSDKAIIKSEKPEDVLYSELISNSGKYIDFNKNSVVWHNDPNYTEIQYEGRCYTMLKKEILNSFAGYRFANNDIRYNEVMRNL